jgi:uncharacterized protein (DUF1684 family)
MTDFAQQWQQWHADHEKRRATPHGFLAITGLHWLTATPQRFPDAPGSWSTASDGVTVALAEDEELTVDGTTVTGTHTFGVLPERTDIKVTAGEAILEIAKRGGFDVLRPRHPDNPVRTGYPGTPAYEPTEKWVLTGRYVPFDEPRDVPVGAVAEGIEHVYSSPGRVEFEAAGIPLNLTVFNGDAPGTLFVLFTDATSGVTTYPANRSLPIAAPAPDGSVVLDFNRAVNLPCAYTEFATCPLPPAENRLPVAVEAGEQIPVPPATR